MGFGSSKPKLKEHQKLIIDEQQQKSICKIRINYDDIGYGFLALSPLTNKKILVAKIDSSYFLSKVDSTHKFHLLFQCLFSIFVFRVFDKFLLI